MKAPAQLLRVYLDYDQVECAAVLLSGYLDALIGVMLGMDSLAFGLKVCWDLWTVFEEFWSAALLPVLDWCSVWLAWVKRFAIVYGVGDL